MNIVLVCLNNFQEYILTNIQQLIRLGHKNIYILTNGDLFTHFKDFNDYITLVDVNLLQDSYNFMNRCNMDTQFRGGFWVLTSMRFFYIYAFMIKYNVENIIHIENDVLLYYNCDELQDKLTTNFVYIPFDNMKRNITSIMYIPTSAIFKTILDHYSPYETDMFNFSIIQQKTGLIQPFPIFCEEHSPDSVVAFVSKNFSNFNYIFDGAAIGQYFGGIDPRNNPEFYSLDVNPINNDDCKVGFVNESCVIKFDQYSFVWKMDDNIPNLKRPFVIINNQELPIFNLHIHSKKLEKFV